MYELAVAREVDAVHYLIGGDWGDENRPHTHHYKVEARMAGTALDRHGYLVDIVAVEEAMDELAERYRGRTLNDLEEFSGLNPSIEHFCRIWCGKMLERLDASTFSSFTVRIWENDIAWASYTESL